MATNKHAIIRYQVLDRCFRNTGRKYFIEDLVDACSEELYQHAGIADGVKKRQVQEDIKFMESDAGFRIRLARLNDARRVYFRYEDTSFSISSQPLNEAEASQLKEAMMTLNRFKGMPQFEWVTEMIARLELSFDFVKSNEQIIEFDQNPFLKGLEFFSSLFHAIMYKKCLKIKYKGVREVESSERIISPHYLKQYNNRWFLFGVQDGYSTITNLALDRMDEILESTAPFQLSTTNFSEYFDDVVGVSIPKDSEPELIVLKVHESLYPYITSKPIHPSQSQKEEKDGEHYIVKLKLIPNYELESLLLSYGEKITVSAPETLKNTMMERMLKTINNYKF